jgi:hypothetical protein
VYLRGELQQTITGMTKGKLYRVRFYTSHLPIWEAYVANKEGFVKLGDEYHDIILPCVISNEGLLTMLVIR